MEKVLEFFRKNYKITNFLVKNTIIGFLILLVFHFANFFDINYILRFRYVMIIVFSLFTFLLFLFFEKEKEKIKIYEKYFKISFLFGLFLTFFANLDFEFIKNFELLSLLIKILNIIQNYIVVLTIISGFFTFYLNPKERKFKRNTKDKFENELRGIDKIPVFKNIIKLIYKEGWKYSVGLIIIASAFIAIKIITPMLYTGSYIDEYFHIFTGISLLEDGEFAKFRISEIETDGYRRGSQISMLVYMFFYIFGQSLFVAKMVPAFLGLVNFILLFSILKNFIKNKFVTLVTLGLFTFNFYTIFNHFYIRMYVWYEFMLLLTIFAFFNLIKAIQKRQNIKILTFLTLIIIINYSNYYWTWDDGGKNAILFINGLFIFYIYLFETQKIFIKNKLFLLLNRLFQANIKQKLIIFLLFTPILYFVFSIGEKIDWLLEYSPRGSTKDGGFTELFFKTNSTYTIIFLLAPYIILFSKNKYKKIIVAIAFLLFSIHLISNPDLHLTRTITYFFPLFFLVCAFSFYKLYNITRDSLLIILTAIIIIIPLILPYPKDFPEVLALSEINYTDYKKIYRYVKKEHGGSIIINTTSKPYISKFYGVEPDYFVIFTNNVVHRRYVDIDTQTLFYNKTEVIENPVLFKTLMSEKNEICVIVREPNRNTLLGNQGSILIDNHLTKKKQYYNITLYCKD